MALGKLDADAIGCVLDDLAETPAQAASMKMDYELRTALANDRRRTNNDLDIYFQG